MKKEAQEQHEKVKYLQGELDKKRKECKTLQREVRAMEDHISSLKDP